MNFIINFILTSSFNCTHMCTHYVMSFSWCVPEHLQLTCCLTDYVGNYLIREDSTKTLTYNAGYSNTLLLLSKLNI